jgi:hypothetical protein
MHESVQALLNPQLCKTGSKEGAAEDPMCYTRRDQRLERETHRVTESRLMEEEARYRQEEHQRRREREEKPPSEKVKEIVGIGR